MRDSYFYYILVLLNAGGPLGDEELHMFVQQLSGRHCRRLTAAIKSKSRAVTKSVEQIVDENGQFLFDMEGMLRRWIKDQKYSDHEAREKLHDAVKSARGKGWEGMVSRFLNES